MILDYYGNNNKMYVTDYMFKIYIQLCFYIRDEN